MGIVLVNALDCGIVKADDGGVLRKRTVDNDLLDLFPCVNRYVHSCLLF